MVVELSYEQPHAFWWGAQLGGSRSSVVEHVKSFDFTQGRFTIPRAKVK
jgi:hypothetical protein